MKIALLAKNKLGFVDGTYSKDSLPDEMGYQWEPCNVIVLSWILNTVSKELSARIIFASSVAVVWNDLSERLHKIDGSRIYFLHREIISHFQAHVFAQARYHQILSLLNKEPTVEATASLAVSLPPLHCITRSVKTPAWMKDYICSNQSSTSLVTGGAQGVLSAQIILWHEASF
ncbi:hypothetical protein V6Z11_A08G250600 [Gossypium hirsutum]|uniref:Uncharacterized protein isoform X4 n=1 Tax=Gossypium hirsutum TaxID=3635 RepID=A0A1U8IH98_GOSHI|nr:uncharacterized protein LOC107895035 isoform X4 [Gossypium hirsutum]